MRTDLPTPGVLARDRLPRQLHTVSTDLVTRTRQVHRRGNVIPAIGASARLPVLFSPIPDDKGRLLVDGSARDNLPVNHLTERDEGPVVAVNIAMGGGGGGGNGRSAVARPRVPALWETLLRTMMIGKWWCDLRGAGRRRLGRHARHSRGRIAGVAPARPDDRVRPGRSAGPLLDQSLVDLGAPLAVPAPDESLATAVPEQVPIA